MASPKRKKLSRAQKKALSRIRRGRVVKARSIRVWARDLASYRHICEYVRWYRRMVRRLASAAVAELGATSMAVQYKPKTKKGKNGKKTT